MKLLSIKPLLISSLLIFIVMGAFSQLNTNELKKERAQKLKEIETLKKILNETKISKNNSFKSLKSIETKILARERLIKRYTEDINYIDNEVNRKQKEIIALEKQIISLKSKFQNLLYQGYKLNNTKLRLGWFMGSQSINHTYKKWYYLKKMYDYRKSQFQLLKEKQLEASRLVNSFIEDKSNKIIFVNEKEKEFETLIENKKEKEEVVKSLQKSEQLILSEIEENKKTADLLNSKINETIRQQIALEKEKKEERKREKEKEESVILKDTKLTISDYSNFVPNGLAWPVSGYISNPYGTRTHDKLKSIKLVNNGVDITTKQSEDVKAVYDGQIVAVFNLPGMHTAVLVKHGNYYTVYANLSGTKVQKGENVKQGENLGNVAVDEDGISNLHFEVWQGNKKLNPEIWLKNN